MRTLFFGDIEASDEVASDEVIRHYSPSSFTTGRKQSTNYIDITMFADVKAKASPSASGEKLELT